MCARSLCVCEYHACVPGRHKLQHHYLLALYDKGDELSAEITPRTRSQLICNLTFTFLGQLGQREGGRRGTRIQQVLQGEVGHLTYASHSHTRLSHSVTNTLCMTEVNMLHVATNGGNTICMQFILILREK